MYFLFFLSDNNQYFEVLGNIQLDENKGFYTGKIYIRTTEGTTQKNVKYEPSSQTFDSNEEDSISLLFKVAEPWKYETERIPNVKSLLQNQIRSSQSIDIKQLPEKQETGNLKQNISVSKRKNVKPGIFLSWFNRVRKKNKVFHLYFWFFVRIEFAFCKSNKKGGGK